MIPVKNKVDYNVFDQAHIQVQNQARPLVWVRVFEVCWQQVNDQVQYQAYIQIKAQIESKMQ
jgi:hypothetical protein